jgi:DNA-binding NarL/FixJ family response regulator
MTQIPVRVYLIDDHTMIRAALRSMLDEFEEIEVVGDKPDARSALAERGEIAPDVVLLDITMPGMSGLDAIGRIRALSPKTKVIMLTHLEGQSFVTQALQAGAEGYLSKDSESVELALAIRAVHAGNPYLSPRVAQGLIGQIRGTSPEGSGPQTALSSLTQREREVFQLLALGRSNKEVARELGTSLGTAKKHRENLQRKLDCHTAAELARLAIREGLLSS